MGPRTLLLLLLGVLVPRDTRAGECGVGRERPLRGEARGSSGSLVGKTPGNERPRLLCPAPTPSPGPVLSLRCIPTPLFFPLRSSGRSSTSSISLTLRPFRPPCPITSDPGRAPRGGRAVSPLPAPRLPLPEVFPHRRVPAGPRGAPLHHRRLRGRHAVRAVRQRPSRSEDGAAGAVGGG